MRALRLIVAFPFFVTFVSLSLCAALVGLILEFIGGGE